ncbi:MAG: L,D-transpeptidase family protein [Sedimentisphaerales bacterium]|nr:L,D-transpeptidase family protein [Sedimentisphaerales bacterium]
MAKRYQYKSYRQRRRENQNMLLLGLAAVLVVGGMFYLVKKRWAGAAEVGPGQAESTASGHYALRDSGIAPFERVIETPVETPQGAQGKEPEDPQKTSSPAQNPAAEKDTVVVAPISDPVTSPEAVTLIESAVAFEEKGQYIAARNKLNEVLGLELSSEFRNKVKLKMSQLSEQWLFGKQLLEGDNRTMPYQVKSGDVLALIARDYKVSHQLLMKINGIKDARSLQAGTTIKVVQGPFHARVYRSTYSLDLYLGDMFVKTYKVGLGKEGNDTPTGLWRVKSGGKLISPTWTDPDTHKTYVADDPDYPLGSRWIALEGLEGDAKGREGFALHGTKDPHTIGTRSSRGCIRLYNGEIIELYDILVPIHSKVTVVD